MPLFIALLISVPMLMLIMVLIDVGLLDLRLRR
jgi:hypothetical protein